MKAAGGLRHRLLQGFHGTVRLSELEDRSCLGAQREALRGRSVLLATRDQLSTALALIELDGSVRRLVLYPPDVPDQYLPNTMAAAAIDAVVSDRSAAELGARAGMDADPFGRLVTPLLPLIPANPLVAAGLDTEWILLTSGTTGAPKLVSHTLSSLIGAIRAGANVGAREAAVWSTFYDIRRFGGLQIFLRAMVGGGSLILSDAEEPPRDFLTRAGAAGVTHVTGTSSHWRRALMSGAADRIAPQYARISGEIADQPILDGLRAAYPSATVAHAFASTEAGVAFDVNDGLAGFPAALVEGSGSEVQLKIVDGTLRIRSARRASRYLGDESRVIGDEEGFVDTGDLVELRDGRYYFVGRKDGVVNVGGQKVHPEEIEAVINRHPAVQMSLVKAKKNPIMGSVVTADIVLKTGSGRAAEKLEAEILEMCRKNLAAHKVPATIRFVAALNVSPAGKLLRSNA